MLNFGNIPSLFGGQTQPMGGGLNPYQSLAQSFLGGGRKKPMPRGARNGGMMPARPTPRLGIPTLPGAQPGMGIPGLFPQPPAGGRILPVMPGAMPPGGERIALPVLGGGVPLDPTNPRALPQQFQRSVNPYGITGNV